MRIIDIVKTSIANDKLVLEEELERVMNNKNLETDIKLQKVKTIMINLATTDLAFKKFVELMTNDNEEESKQ